MGFLWAVLLGFVPGLLWLWFFYRRERYQPGLRQLTFGVFVAGASGAVLAGLLEAGPLLTLSAESLEETPEAWRLAVAMFAVVGPVEEVVKLGVVRLAAYRSPYFRGPHDGIIYAAIAALGFATLENVFYVAQFGAGVVVVRGIISVPAHIIFTCYAGYALGWAKGRGRRALWLPLAALGFAAGLHGLFDFLLFWGRGSALWLLVIPTLALGGAGVWLLHRRARSGPTGRVGLSTWMLRCPQCQQFARRTFLFCTACGAMLRQTAAWPALYCSHCEGVVQPEASYCPHCGRKLVESLPRKGERLKKV